VLATDRLEWADGLVHSARGLDAIFESFPWHNAATLGRIPEGLVADVVAPLAPKQRTFRRWASQCWQPLVVTSLSRDPGAADFAAELGVLGYRQPVQATVSEDYWPDLRWQLTEVLDYRACLFPALARAWSADRPEMVRVLGTAVLMDPGELQVGLWADRAGLEGPEGLERIVHSWGLPEPRRLVRWLRLVRAVDFKIRLGDRVTRDSIAERVGWKKGEYLGKVARELTGLSFGELAGGGLELLLEIVAERLA
jgi:hypothetical protein